MTDALSFAGVETEVMIEVEPGTCSLRLTVTGGVERCPQERCAFWEAGGAVIRGTCLLERLGIEISRTDLAAYLLETRERIENARDKAEVEAAHREFSRRLGTDL